MALNEFNQLQPQSPRTRRITPYVGAALGLLFAAVALVLVLGEYSDPTSETLAGYDPQAARKEQDSMMARIRANIQSSFSSVSSHLHEHGGSPSLAQKSSKKFDPWKFNFGGRRSSSSSSLSSSNNDDDNDDDDSSDNDNSNMPSGLNQRDQGLLKSLMKANPPPGKLTDKDNNLLKIEEQAEKHKAKLPLPPRPASATGPAPAQSLGQQQQPQQQQQQQLPAASPSQLTQQAPEQMVAAPSAPGQPQYYYYPSQAKAGGPIQYYYYPQQPQQYAQLQQPPQQQSQLQQPPPPATTSDFGIPPIPPPPPMIAPLSIRRH